MASRSNREKIFQKLLVGPCCDDCLAKVAGVSPRQTVNQICRGSKTEISRDTESCPQCGKTKLVNRFIGDSTGRQSPRRISPTISVARPWYWEGNVQHRIVDYLETAGCLISSAADTESREAGKDIEAETEGARTLWITVKGLPEKSRNTQARHWFSQALFDLILYREEDSNVKLGIGLPDEFPTYRNFSRRITWFKRTVPFNFYWVTEKGFVRVE